MKVDLGPDLLISPITQEAKADRDYLFKASLGHRVMQSPFVLTGTLFQK